MNMHLFGYPRGVADPLCAEGHPVAESTDRRMLWHIEGELAVGPYGEYEKARRLRTYLNATCAHHWHDYETEGAIPAHRQCLWCSGVEWVSPVEMCTNSGENG